MIKKVVIGTAALMLAASAYAYAQQPSGGRDGGRRSSCARRTAQRSSTRVSRRFTPVSS